jgi:hypothetical protein
MKQWLKNTFIPILLAKEGLKNEKKIVSEVISYKNHKYFSPSLYKIGPSYST